MNTSWVQAQIEVIIQVYQKIEEKKIKAKLLAVAYTKNSLLGAARQDMEAMMGIIND